MTSFLITCVLFIFSAHAQLYAQESEERSFETPPQTLLGDAPRVSEHLPSMALSDTNNQFNLLTYNIFNRPFLISHDGQTERSCRIPEEIFKQIARHDHIDAIVIEEAFTDGCRSGSELRTLLRFYGWPYSTQTIDKGTSLSNGGIFIASKWPIALSEQHVFDSCAGSDCLAAKGVIYARINKKIALGNVTVSYHIFGTHFNAWEGAKQAKVRTEQAKEIITFIRKQDIPNNEAVLIAGDLNINRLDSSGNRSEVKQVLAIMHAIMPEIAGEQGSTADPTVNPLALGYGSKPQWLDYVLYSDQYLKPAESSMQSILLQANTSFRACMKATLQPYDVRPDSSWCQQTSSLIDLSDHYPVLGKFKY